MWQKKVTLSHPELKTPGNVLVKFDIEHDEYDILYLNRLRHSTTVSMNLLKMVQSYLLMYVMQMVLFPHSARWHLGNKLGFALNSDLKEESLFAPAYGCIAAEVAKDKLDNIKTAYTKLGEVKEKAAFTYIREVSINVEEALSVWEDKLEKVFPTKVSKETTSIETKLLMLKMYMYARIRLQSLQYLFRYSQVQTVSMTAQRHLKELEQMLL